MATEKEYRRTVITKDAAKGSDDFRLLYEIFSSTLKPDMTWREFSAYYLSSKLDYIDVTFVFVNQVLAGFCAAAFYTSLINQSSHTIGRAATGILPHQRGNTLPKWKLYKKYIRYWLKHPLRPFLLSAYVANPLIYAMICKYTGIAFPQASRQPPANIIHIKNELLRSQNLLHKEVSPFVVEIHFHVAMDEAEMQRIVTSRNKNVKYYLKINPSVGKQYGVLVIIPVNLKNITFSASKFLYHGTGKWLRHLTNELEYLIHDPADTT